MNTFSLWPQNSSHFRFLKRSWATLVCTTGLVTSFSCGAATAGDTIQAENFVNMSGIQLESTTDLGGGQNIGWLDAGDWMTYSFNAPVAGSYQVSYRIASLNGGGMVQIENAGGAPAYGTVNIPSTGGWQTWVTITQIVNLPSGNQTLGLAVKSGGWNLNWFKVDSLKPISSSSSSAASSQPSSQSSVASSAQSSSSSKAGFSIKVEAEGYQAMQGVQTENTNDQGGGLNVGWTDSGDWLSYNEVNLPCTGTYLLTNRVASNLSGAGFTFEKAGGGVTYAKISVPNTGGWQTWQSLSQDVSLPGGPQKFGIASTQGGWNLNWFNLTLKSCSGSSSSSVSSTPSTLTAKVAAKNMGKGFNLGNMFDVTASTQNFAAAKNKIDAYYAMGFRNVRIPITWTEVISGSTLVNNPQVGDVNRNHPRLTVIKQVIDYSLSLPDMYVVINAHHEGALKENNRADVLERLWSDIADIFRDKNHNLLFEILNEPHLGNGSAMDAGNLRNMTIRAYSKIRAVDSQRIVLFGGNQWFGANEMAQVWTNLNGMGNGQDAYLMATFHHYNPWSFNGDNQGDYADNWTDSDLVSPMDTMLNWTNTVGNGMPVYIGEWGTGWGSRYTSMQCNNIRLWYTKFGAQAAPAKGMPTAVWDDGGWFKIYDLSNFTFANNLAQCINGNCSWDAGNRFNAGCF